MGDDILFLHIHRYQLLFFVYLPQAPTTMAGAAQKTKERAIVVADRLKHRQCIYCGTHTRNVFRRFRATTEKIQLNIPGLVEHGRCMRVKCQDAALLDTETARQDTVVMLLKL
jgi:hypothetical protein